MNKSDQINELAAALSKAQGELENAAKSCNNGHFKSKYADLAEVINTVRPVLANHGLSVSQFPSYQSGVVSVETILMHSSGQWLSGTISAPVSKQDAQGVGSATTYCRRYSLAAVVGIAQEDDDANSAVGSAPTQPETQPEPKAVPKPRISPQQAEHIRNALKVAGINESGWCEIAKIPSIDMLPAEKFDGAMAFIKSKAIGNAAQN